MKRIVIKGAREHNLKNINLTLPRNQFIVITGLSGSGKSSLAFDTIYAEGQRRYLESFSSYARQFLDKMKKADVDYIAGLSPTISIEQRQISKNQRSTVGTVTEIYDYMRLLFAKVGDMRCYNCNEPIGSQTKSDIVQTLLATFGSAVKERRSITILAPLVRGRKGEYKKVIQEAKKQGFSQVRIDNTIYDLLSDSLPKLHKTRRHDLDIIIDRLYCEKKSEERINRAVDIALKQSGGTCLIIDDESKKEKLYSEKLYCGRCNIGFSECTPNMFSFNSPYGACSECHGLGKVSRLAENKIIKDSTKPLLRGGLNKELFFAFNKYYIEDLWADIVRTFHVEAHVAYEDLPDEVKDAFFWGNEEIYGLRDILRDQLGKTQSDVVRTKLRRFIHEDTCPICKGSRLKKESLGVTIENRTITGLASLSISELDEFFTQYSPRPSKRMVAEPILKEIRERLSFLVRIGVDYLSLDRPVSTLGGGEYQRIKLGSQIGVGLSGVLYILDEPSIGLHPKNNDKLIDALKTLRDLNNTIIVVEHDDETIRSADYIVDLGPGAGIKGGKVIAQGTGKQFLKNNKSLTARYMSGKESIPVPKERTPIDMQKAITIRGAREHNLKDVTAYIPCGLFTCVTGVSGSGKSTLIHDTLYPVLHNILWKTNYSEGIHTSVEGHEHIDKIIEIDQSPIGRSPRSNPATYIDLFVHIRKLFAQLPEAKLRGYKQDRFSFNLKGGRCEECRGEGMQKLEMSFLPDMYVVCETCNGKRYNEQTLDIRYKNKSMYDVLEMTVDEAREVFDAIPSIREKLLVLQHVGLGYIKLGQASTTLSGGEAQRVKLAAELSRRSTGKTLYLFDEPTTGLHFHDIYNLMKAILQLRDQGNTIVIIEHNMDVIKMADYVIDLGPEGGRGGGTVIATGTPEEIAQKKESHTGYYLRKKLSL